ncbi:uncharacterized protein [Drosophila tropicalis]|uniref:uncharacterized protein isoform X1 n=1 Tax=Drosophila tropicalis TaxID=46794 RepID=UPI0035AC0E58
MVDSVQCPVCTLYLHAGMNLSDHLETHPKEQVIKALVQMTIVGNGGSGNGNGMGSALAAAMLATSGGDNATTSSPMVDVKPSTKTLPIVKGSSSNASSPAATAATSQSTLQPPPLSSSVTGGAGVSTNKLNNPPTKATLKGTPPMPSTPTTEATSAKPSAPTTIYQPSLAPTEYGYDQQQQPQQPAPQQHGFPRGATATLVIPQVPQQHFLASQQQQQTLFAHQTQQTQPGLKYGTYGNTSLPPPPPLQIFTQQQQQGATQSQSHQKPPPAYGAAISQIRSQHNQNKQQQHHHHLNMHHNITLAPPTNTNTTTNGAGKQQASKVLTEVFLNPPPPPPPLPQLPASGQAQHHQHHHHQHHPHQHHQQQQQQQTHQVLLATSCSSSSSSSSIRGNRQTNSPFGALLNAAAAVACAASSSSPSPSVLRYAESPVAHYLERENGDFIVQETPKHIVECVETEDGEFSVIERIYQSPPSVLHIHDDEEDEDGENLVGNADDNEDEEDFVDNVRKDEEDLTETSDHHVDHDGDDEREENSRSRNLSKTTTKKSRKSKPKRTAKQLQRTTEEEFMSLSSGEESVSENAERREQKKLEATQPPLCTAPSTSTAAAAASSAAATSSATVAAAGSSNTTEGNSTSTKSKKNRITVLSDVPLNMNEYLDLMGNIVASSRIGQARPFAAVAPIPLVKVEKEEPLDDYDNESVAEEPQVEQKPSLGTTSVIRMASTTTTATTTASGSSSLTTAEDLTQPPLMKIEVEATTLLAPRFSAPAPTTTQRGPKKLVIKPKATSATTTTKKTDTHTLLDPQPSSSSSSASSSNQIISNGNANPAAPVASEMVQIKSENLEPPSTSSNSILEKHLTKRKHSTVNDDDARVLLEFANSKQSPALSGGAASNTTFVVNAAVSSFPSAGSVFASSSSTQAPNQIAPNPADEYILPDNNLEVDEIVISSSSSYAASCASQQLQNQSQVQTQTHASNSIHDFNFLYHQNTTQTTAATSAAGGNAYFTPFARQQQQPHHHHHNHGTTSEATNAATLASSSSNSSALDHDSMNATFRVTKTQSSHSWYHPVQQQQAQTSTAATAGSGGGSASDLAQPTNFNAALAAVDCCSVAVDGGDVKAYLDLDACKREQLSNSSNLPSVSASTTSSSFAGAGTESSLVGGLNIRTDEKMPAKGEISEQESNCDIENSWSQSMYGDISQRYFRNQFSAGYNTDWRQDYYPAQDLSSAQREQKRFDFNAVVDDEASSISRKSLPIPTASTSSSISSALLAGPPIASTSRAAAEAAAEAAAAVAAMAQQRKPPPRRKIYKCPHCEAIFEKLKERNAHMISDHNYVRQNRRLICTQPLVSASSSSMLPPQSQQQTQHQPMMHQPDHGLLQEDSKDGIVKIKQEQCQDKHEAEQQLLDHAELADMKDAELLGHAAGLDGGDIKPPGVGDMDNKLTIPPLAMTTPAAKLAALYRMLMAYNESKLGQDRNISELEQNAMEKSIFLCYVCRTDFPTVKLYDAHLTEHPAECFTCGKKFYRWKNFSLHLKRHLGWKEFGCCVCDKKFVVRSALVEHMRMHTGQTPLKCKICGKKFKRYSNLTQHRKRHTKMMVRKKEYVCHCGEVLPSKARFLWHKETHDLKPKCCPYCCDRFVHANSLRRHIRLAHSDKFDYAEPMECPMCKQIFAKTSIKAHMATHSTDPQYDCAICNKSFSTKWNLKIHSWVHANRTAKPFKCEYCPKAFVRELDFKNHINAHKQIKPYTCEYCGCKFIRKYNYMRHRREHHGNKMFTCDQCDKSFHRHYYLIEHRRIHTGERPFHCTICGKSSTTKTNHNKHLKIHHSRDPFTVEV